MVSLCKERERERDLSVVNCEKDHCEVGKCTLVRDVMALSKWTGAGNIPKIRLHIDNLFLICADML